jgi:hypothetical protein
VPFLKRLLVHAERCDIDRRPPREPSTNRSLQDAVHRIPRQSQEPCDRIDARFLRPVDDETLEQSRISRIRLSPWHVHLPHAMLRTIDPRYIGYERRLELHGVEMPPRPLLRVVSRARRAAFRARQRRRPAHEPDAQEA